MYMDTVYSTSCSHESLLYDLIMIIKCWLSTYLWQAEQGTVGFLDAEALVETGVFLNVVHGQKLWWCLYLIQRENTADEGKTDRWWRAKSRLCRRPGPGCSCSTNTQQLLPTHVRVVTAFYTMVSYNQNTLNCSVVTASSVYMAQG